jgi:hypothetical protein
VNGGGVVKATFDTIITMRANNTPTQVVADSTLVKGVTGGFKF